VKPGEWSASDIMISDYLLACERGEWEGIREWNGNGGQ
jgi:hypothetical protein